MLHAHALAPFTKPLILSHIFCLALFTQMSVTAVYAESFEQLKYVTQPITERKPKLHIRYTMQTLKVTMLRLCHSCLLLTPLHQIFAYSLMLLLLVLCPLSKSLSSS
jgi:hypothetical protein